MRLHFATVAFATIFSLAAAPSLAQDLASSAVAVTPVPAEAPVNFSLLGLFLSADWIVKIVMLGLLAASIWCWAIIIDKSMLYGRANRQMNQFERVFWSGQSLEELYQQMQERPSMGLGAIFVAAMKEWKRSHEQNAASFIGMQARLDNRPMSGFDPADGPRLIEFSLDDEPLQGRLGLLLELRLDRSLKGAEFVRCHGYEGRRGSIK